MERVQLLVVGLNLRWPWYEKLRKTVVAKYMWSMWKRRKLTYYKHKVSRKFAHQLSFFASACWSWMIWLDPPVAYSQIKVSQSKIQVRSTTHSEIEKLTYFFFFFLKIFKWDCCQDVDRCGNHILILVLSVGHQSAIFFSRIRSNVCFIQRSKRKTSIYTDFPLNFKMKQILIMIDRIGVFF